MKKYKIVYWIDSSVTSEQTTERIKPTKVETIGWVVEENDDYITLGFEKMEDGSYRSLVAIPKVTILK